jgi:hypothetical protein
LSVNGVQVGATRFAHVVPVRFSATETFDIGEDRGAPASDQYAGVFKFTGDLKRVVIEIDPAVDLHAPSVAPKARAPSASQSSEQIGALDLRRTATSMSRATMSA